MPARVPVTLTFDFIVDDIKWQLWLAFVLRLNLPADTPDLPQAGQEIARFSPCFRVGCVFQRSRSVISI